ncbi:hypothetical protein H8D30_05050 [bacterium]|nr:hypothetical protein [bacterium]
MSGAKGFGDRVGAFVQERGLKVSIREMKLLREVALDWERRWVFVGRTVEWTEGLEGLYLHLTALHRGQVRHCASLRCHGTKERVHIFVQAPNPERHLWIDDGGLASRLDALCIEWRALEHTSGEGEHSLLVRLEDFEEPEEVAFVVDDIMEVLNG